MKIKIGDKIYSGDVEPVMVILSEQDKINIKNMNGNATKYCVYPEELMSVKEIKEWMKVEK